MSLIESALARAKALAGSTEVAGGRRETDKSRMSASRHKPSTSAVREAQPAERIPTVARLVNREVCRENRVLIEETTNANSGAAAAYRILRARTLRRARSHNWTTIGVTSAMPNDGKSLTALNLAISLAREGNSDVVLLDLDMRAPSMCEYLGVTPPGHLVDYFEKRASLTDMFFSIGVDRLVLAAATLATERASELLASAEFEQLIDYVKARSVSPIVLIDLPPVLVTDDVLVVAPKIDALLVVASEGYTNRADLDKALGLIAEFPTVGLVLNRAVETGQAYGYGYGYGDDAPR